MSALNYSDDYKKSNLPKLIFLMIVFGIVLATSFMGKEIVATEHFMKDHPEVYGEKCKFMNNPEMAQWYQRLDDPCAWFALLESGKTVVVIVIAAVAGKWLLITGFKPDDGENFKKRRRNLPNKRRY